MKKQNFTNRFQPYGAISVALKICEMSEWSVSNLQLQKLLYMVNLVYLGMYGKPAVVEYFEAWKYGPILPEVYHRCKICGNRPVRNFFYEARDIKDKDLIEVIDFVLSEMSGKSDGHMLALCTHKDGAYASSRRAREERSFWGKLNVFYDEPIYNSELKKEYDIRWRGNNK